MGMTTRTASPASATKTTRPAKGTPTDLNVSTMAMHFDSPFAVGSTAPNAICPTSVAGMRKCIKFGYVAATREGLTLTASGSAAILAQFAQYPHEIAIHTKRRVEVLNDLRSLGFEVQS